MADHYLSLPGGLTACFKSASDIHADDHIRLQLGAYVPGLTFLDSPTQAIDLTIEHKKSAAPRLECQGDTITLHSASDEKFPADLYHLIYGAARRALLQRGFYSVHAACAGDDDGYSLIVGHSGAGKTTLTHKLIEQHGMKLFSGNKTVVRFDEDGSVHAVAGTKTMTALGRDLKRYAYEMRADQYAPQADVKITSIAIVRVNDGVREIEKLGPVSALHTLYPYFMDAVNADVIVNGRDIFDGAPDTGSKNDLSVKLSRALDRLPVRKCSGSMAFLLRAMQNPEFTP